MSFRLNRGEAETFVVTPKAAEVISRGDLLAYNRVDDDGTVIKALATSTVADLIGVAAEDITGDGTAKSTVIVPKDRNTTFKVAVTGGQVVDFEYYDLSDAATVDAAASTIGAVRVVDAISATEAEVVLAFA